jgi:hypothetical protein
MNSARKNLVLSIVFLLSLVFFYNVTFQNSNISFTIELTSGNNSISDSISDSEIYDDDQVTNKIEITSTIDNSIQPCQFQVISRITQPSDIVWEPPKIS